MPLRRHQGILFYGDPHGEWRPLLRACAEQPPAAVVILGDCDLGFPVRRQIAPVFDAGVRVRWIPGNHDVDKAEWYDRLWSDHPSGNLHATFALLDDIVVVGLGGIFKEQVWYPKHCATAPVCPDRRTFIRRLKPGERWRGGLPLAERATIFPEDAIALNEFRADVLVTHEAPTTHPHGFAGVDDVARACRARLVVHGHHHQSYDGRIPGGTWVKGLAKGELFRLTADLLG